MREDGCALMIAIVALSIIVLPALTVALELLAITVFEALTPSVEAAEVKEPPVVATCIFSENMQVIKPETPIFEPIEEEPQEDFENQLIEEALLARSHKIESCKITYYCCEKYPHICGTGDGITAMGTEVTPGVSCAVPKPIPLGSTIIIDWGDGSDREYRVGDDRGGGVIGDHIDLAVPTHHEALDLGVARATVYWVEEE